MRTNRKNTRPLMKHRWPRTVIFLLTLVMSCAAVGKENQEKLLRTLKAGIDEYLRKVEFKCTYTYSEYLVDSREKAELFDTSDGRLLLRATGSLIKSNKMTFESFVLDQANTEGACFFNDHITVTNSDLCADYFKQGDGAIHRTLFVSEPEKTESGIPLLDQACASIFCPLTYGGGRAIPNIIDLCDVMADKYHNETTIDVSHTEISTVISMHFDLPNVESTTSTTTLSDCYPYPIVTCQNKETRNYLLNSHFYGTTRVFDLIDVGKDFVVPKRIYNATGPVKADVNLGEDAEGKWIVRKWESEDLGKEPPKAEDFLIPLDRDTDFGGLDLELVHKLNRNVPEYFDINSFTLADLFYSAEPKAAAPDAKASKYYRPAIIVLGALIVAAGIYRKWRNSGRRHANQS